MRLPTFLLLAAALSVCAMDDEAKEPAPAPVIDAVQADRVSLRGGGEVVLHGSGFGDADVSPAAVLLTNDEHDVRIRCSVVRYGYQSTRLTCLPEPLMHQDFPWMTDHALPPPEGLGWTTTTTTTFAPADESNLPIRRMTRADGADVDIYLDLTLVSAGGEVTRNNAVRMSRSHTPRVSAISPAQGGNGDEVTIYLDNWRRYWDEDRDEARLVGSAVRLAVVSVEWNKVVVQLPETPFQLPSGTHPIAIRHGTYGWAEADGSARFRVLPKITGVSPSTVSTNGGAEITITGSGFASTTSEAPPVAVSIAGLACVLDDAAREDDSVVCTVPDLSAAASAVGEPAVRGFLLEIWDDISSLSELADVVAYAGANAPSSSAIATHGLGTSSRGVNYLQRMSGFICAPATASYRFTVTGDDVFWLSLNGGAVALEGRHTQGSETAELDLALGECIDFELYHVQYSGGDYVSVSMTLVSDDAASEIMQYGLDSIVETGEPVNEQQQIAIGALPLAQSTLQIVANETDASVLIGDIDLADADAEKALRRALVHSPHPYGADLFTGDVLSSAVISWSNENENGNNMYSQSGYRLCKDKNADGDLIVGEFDEDDGTWDCQVEVWAGSSSNGGRLSARFSVEDYPLFCFDYRITSNYQFLHFQWHVSGLTKWKQIDAPAGAFVKDDQWHSTCIDLVALFPAGATDLIGFRIASSSITGAISELQGAWIRSAAFVPLGDSASRNVYDVAITGQLPEVNVTLFAGPNAVGNSTDLPSSVEDFDAALGGIAYGDDVVVDLTASSTDAPILLANATWTLNTTVLALSASAADVTAALYPVTADAPQPTVVRTGRPASGITFTALWSSSDVRRASTGRLPLLEASIDDAELADVDITIVRSVSGGRKYDIVPGDMMRAAADGDANELVVLSTFDGPPASCADETSIDACIRLTLVEQTTVTALSTSDYLLADLPLDVTITGTGFTANNDVSVTVGGTAVSCATPSIDTEIVCTLDASLPIGVHAVVVTDAVLGNSNGDFAVTISPSLDGTASPDVGSVNGGTLVTVPGAGFDAAVVTVTVDGVDCAVDVDASDASNIVCVTGAAAGTVDSAVDVVVSALSDGTVLATATAAYTYATASTPVISSVLPASGSRNGGTVVVIETTGMDAADIADVTVLFGDDAGIDCSKNTGTITCTTPAFGFSADGTLDVSVSVPTIGSVTSAAAFAADAASTPILLSATPQTAAPGDVVTLFGTFFNAASASVVVDDIEQTLDGSSTDSELIFTVQDTVVGGTTAIVSVSVDPQGSAIDTVAIDMVSRIDSISGSPITASLNGGAVFTVSGASFPDEIDVTVGGIACDSTTFTSSAELICNGAPSGLAADVAVDVCVLETCATAVYTASASATPSLSASSSVLPADGQITLTAANLAAGAVSVSTDNEDVTVSIASDDGTDFVIDVLAPLAVAGDAVTITLSTEAGGASDGVELTAELDITNVHPHTVSSAGSTLVTLSGTGICADVRLVVNDQVGPVCEDRSVCLSPAADAPATVGIACGDDQVITQLGAFALTDATPVLASTIPAAVTAGDSITVQVTSDTVAITEMYLVLDDTYYIPCSTAVTGSYACEFVVDAPITGDVSVGVSTVPVGLVQMDATTMTITGDATLTVSAVEPARGSSAGGTLVTLTGAGIAEAYDNDAASVKVFFGDAECTVTSASVGDSELVCETEAAETFNEPALANVTVAGRGIATASASFQIIDAWSSTHTWGDGPLPVEGDTIVVPAGQVVLLDVSPPDLFMLILEGELWFDVDTAQDLELRTQYIVVRGGALRIGTEETPFPAEFKATVTMLGNPYNSPELPTYGAKGIAVRRGTVDMHGADRGCVWTRLSRPISIGDTDLYIDVSNDHLSTGCVPGDQHNLWKVDGELVVASSSERMFDAEEAIITAIEAVGDGTSEVRVVVDRAFTNEHWGDFQTYAEAGRTIDTRAEVGYLTSNVKFQGVPDEDTFKYDFGAHMLVHEGHGQVSEGVVDTNTAPTTVRLANLEVRYAGQAFRLGRYPIHFHMMGFHSALSTSYLKSCSIHHTFQRALTIHGSHGLHVQRNVAFQTLGHTYFLEDGIETDNVFEDNLGLMTLPSHSSLNTDLTPTTYWITNPSNTFRRNVAAGSHGYGFWMRMLPHPEGPSFTTSQCPDSMPLTAFEDNTAHSNGRYGLRIFPKLLSREDPCDSSSPFIPANITRQLSYMNRLNGIVGTEVGDLRIIEAAVADNRQAGIEVTTILKREWEIPMVSDSLIIGRSQLNTIPNEDFFTLLEHDAIRKGDPNEGSSGIWGPKTYYFLVDNSFFYNFAEPHLTALTHCSNCKIAYFQGGFESRIQRSTFINSPNRVLWRWEHEGVWLDMDGTLTSRGAMSAAVPRSPLTREPWCFREEIDEPFTEIGSFPGDVCTSDITFRRVGLNAALPKSSFEGEDLLVRDVPDDITMLVPWKSGRDTHPKGYQFLIPVWPRGEYELKFDTDLADIEHIQFATSQLEADEAFVFRVPYQYAAWAHVGLYATSGHQSPIGELDAVPTGLGDVTRSGSIYTNGTVEGEPHECVITGHGSDWGSMSEFRNLHLNTYVCAPGEKCVDEDVPETVFSGERFLWSNPATWVTFGLGLEDVPTEGDEVIIPSGAIVELDVASTPVLGNMEIFGHLEFQDGVDRELNAERIVIRGPFGSLDIGSEAAPFMSNAVVQIHGDRLTEMYAVDTSVMVGSMALAVFGELNIYGHTANKASSAFVVADAAAGTTSVVVQGNATQWSRGDDVVITGSGFAAASTSQTVRITSVLVNDEGNTVVTFNAALEHAASGSRFTENGMDMEARTMLGLVSHNVVVRGVTDAELFGMVTHVGVKLEQVNTTAGVVTIPTVGKASIAGAVFSQCGQLGFDDVRSRCISLNGVQGGVHLHNMAISGSHAEGVGTDTGSADVVIEDIVISGLHDTAMLIKGSGHTVINNLITALTLAGDQPSEVTALISGIEIAGSRHVVEGNWIIGSEGQGFWLLTTAAWCVEGMAPKIADNYIHGVLFGVYVETKSTGCATLANTEIAFAWEAGVWTFAGVQTKVEKITIRNVNAGLGLHIGGELTAEEAHIRVSDVTIIGRDEALMAECRGANGDVLNLPSAGRPRRPLNFFVGEDDGAIQGLIFSTMNVAPNKELPKDVRKVKNNPLDVGFVEIDGLHVAGFYTSCPATEDDDSVVPLSIRMSVMHTNPKAYDVCAAVAVSKATVEDTVATDALMRFEPPNPNWVNLGECGDMDCDGNRHCLVRDVDGTLLGNGAGATVFPDHQDWPNWVIGDPLWWQYEIDADRSIDETGMGIYRGQSSQCSIQNEWQGVLCRGVDHEQIVIQSLDADRDARRVAPVGISTNGYTDLLNGAADHEICGLNKCHKRIQQFWGVIAPRERSVISFTGTNPKKTRYQMPSAVDRPSSVVALSVWYTNPQRLDVYVNNVKVERSTQSRFEAVFAAASEHGRPGSFPGDLSRPIFGGETAPTTSSGSNWFDISTRTLHFLVSEDDVVEIRTSKVVQVTMHIEMSISDFFADDFQNNVALLLDIDPSTVKIVDIREGSVIVDFELAEDDGVDVAAANTVLKEVASGERTFADYDLIDMSLVATDDEDGVPLFDSSPAVDLFEVPDDVPTTDDVPTDGGSGPAPASPTGGDGSADGSGSGSGSDGGVDVPVTPGGGGNVADTSSDDRSLTALVTDSSLTPFQIGMIAGSTVLVIGFIVVLLAVYRQRRKRANDVRKTTSVGEVGDLPHPSTFIKGFKLPKETSPVPESASDWGQSMDGTDESSSTVDPPHPFLSRPPSELSIVPEEGDITSIDGDANAAGFSSSSASSSSSSSSSAADADAILRSQRAERRRAQRTELLRQQMLAVAAATALAEASQTGSASRQQPWR